MMIPRPRSLAVALAAVALPLALGLGACGGDDEDDAGGEGATETEETSETTAGAEGEEAGGDAAADGSDDQAAGEAVSTVFDSSVPFDDKVALIEDGESHRADHEAYVGAADGVGGITVEPTEVAVNGDTATVTYRVLFGGNQAYDGLTMDVTRVDGEWIVPSGAFCGFLASARVPCASGG